MNSSFSSPQLRLWCLAAKGYTDLDLDPASSKKAWTEALQIATTIGQDQWAARASGELGIIAFLEGNTASAVSLVGRSILSAYRTGDIGNQVRLLSMLGNASFGLKFNLLVDGKVGSAQLVSEAPNALIATLESVVGNQILPDCHGIAIPTQAQLDDFSVGFTGARRARARRARAFRVFRCLTAQPHAKVGDHPSR